MQLVVEIAGTAKVQSQILSASQGICGTACTCSGYMNAICMRLVRIARGKAIAERSRAGIIVGCAVLASTRPAVRTSERTRPPTRSREDGGSMGAGTSVSDNFI